jgi:flagellar hook assembly protein FlgD
LDNTVFPNYHYVPSQQKNCAEVILNVLPDIKNVRVEPNPFDFETTVFFTLTKKAKINASIWASTNFGWPVNHRKTLVDTVLEPGDYSYKWDGTNANGNQTWKGKYVCRIISEKGDCVIIDGLNKRKGKIDAWQGNLASSSQETAVSLDAGSQTTAVQPQKVITFAEALPKIFDNSTTIRFTLEKETYVNVAIFTQAFGFSNITHRKTLLNKTLPKGTHEVKWDGTNSRNKPAIRGKYKCKIETAGGDDYVVIENLQKLKGMFD